MKKPNLTPEELLNKKFETELSGYNASEVDRYLDMALEDYRTYLEEFKKLELFISEKDALINDKDQEIEKLNIEIKNLKDQVKEANKNTNYELVRKIDELAKKVSENNK